MFGREKEKLLKKVAVLQEENQIKEKRLEKISRVSDEMEEQFARLAVANVSIGKNLESIAGNTQEAASMEEEKLALMQDLQQDVAQVTEKLRKSQVQQDTFFSGMKQQKDVIQEVVESNKHFTTPMKVISETPVTLREEGLQAEKELDEMVNLSKSMGVLALNAAIEAGRMGETGMKFIASAEEIRTVAEQYENAAKQTKQRVSQMSDKMHQMEEQIKHLNQLLKENNISMGKVLKEYNAQITGYEKEKVSVDMEVAEAMAETAELLLKKETELADLQNRIGLQVTNVTEEFSEQQTCNSQIEQMSGKLRK